MLSLLLVLGAFQIAQAQSGFEEVHENSHGSPLQGLIESAQKTIDIEIYEMDDPEIMESLKAATLRGVRIRVVKEGTPVGSPCLVFNPSAPAHSPTCDQQRDLVRYVKSSGGSYVAFNHQTLCGKAGTNCFQHGKLIIVDRAAAMMSTGNFNSTSLCNQDQNITKCNRDYSIVTRDPTVVDELTTIFEKDMKGATYDLPAVMNAGSPRLTVSPYSLNPLIEMIRSAKKSILLQNQYLNELNFNQALMDAAKRGVKVTLMVASACAFGKPKQSDINKWTKIYGAFDQAGVRSRAFGGNLTINGLRGYLHAKVMVIDDEIGWVGSVNGSTTSFNYNREFGLSFTDPEQVRKLTDWITSDLDAEGSESWKESLQCLQDPLPN